MTTTDDLARATYRGDEIRDRLRKWLESERADREAWLSKAAKGGDMESEIRLGGEIDMLYRVLECIDDYEWAHDCYGPEEKR